MNNSIHFPSLWAKAVAQFSLPAGSEHGEEHWRRVERNGLVLATHTGADITVIRLFAVFHDSRRENEFRDDDHGWRGAALAQSWRGTLFDLPDPDFEKLMHACTGHTDGHLHVDPVIGTCWDADRLDLGRVGIDPHERYMSTEFGRQIARAGSIAPFLKSAP